MNYQVPRRHPSNNRRNLRVEQLDPRILLARDTVYISEYLANNDSILADEDGHFSDWIELHNPTTDPVELTGWSLTDSPDEPTKWTLPSATLPADGFQIVFASGKNRSDPNTELHSNFKLASTGEYLALVKPDQTIVQEFTPAYPAQSSDISFGFANDGTSLIDVGSVRTIRVPTEGDNRDAWQTVEFDDSQWREANGAIGYDRRPPNAGFENVELAPWGSRGPVRLTGGLSGVTPTEGLQMAIATTFESTANRSAAEFYLGLPRSSLDTVNTGDVQRVAALRREVTVAAGSVLLLDWNFLTNDVRDGDFAFAFVNDSETLTQLADPASNLVNSLSDDFATETGFRQFAHTFQTAGTYTIGIGVAQAIDQEFDSAVIVDNLRIDGAGDVGQSYESIIETQLAEQFSTIQWRQEFQYDVEQPLSGLRLRVQYDDGFAAYLNGQLVASANAPKELVWNSTAISVRPNERTTAYDEFVIPINLLQPGTNVLAIQGLNAETDRHDFLLDAQLLTVGTVSDVATFLHEPTPGRHNLSTTSPVQFEYTEQVTFDRAAGFYSSPFVLTLSTTADATIRFTTDGSAPSDQNGAVYAQPIPIDSTTIVRAVATKDGLTSREIETASFLFLDQIVQQSNDSAMAAGFPETWDDYELDPDVIGADGQDLFDGKYAASIRDDLLSIPTMSLVMDLDDWFGAEGLFTNPRETGAEWERANSVELIDPNDADGVQIDAGVRIHGGLSRTADKLSMRLMFRSDYGNSKLQYPLFGDDGPHEFDSVVLRSSGSEFKVGFHYIRDQTVRQLEQGTGNPSSHGKFVHVYINGLYWGVYNLLERIDAQFAVSRDGGEKQEYDVITAGTPFVPTATNGTIDAWKHLVSLALNVGRTPDEFGKTTAFMKLQGKHADGTDDPNLESYLDVNNFINYIVINAYVGNTDWPMHNFYMYRRRGPQSEGFRFPVWDAEFSFETSEPRSIPDLNSGPATILAPLLSSESFRIQFADRVLQLVKPGGVLHVNPVSPEWDEEHPENNEPARVYADIANSVSSAIVAESARWGDSEHQFDDQPFARDENWLTVVHEKLTEFFPNRTLALLETLRADDLYRDPPVFSRLPSHVAAGSRLMLTPFDADAPIHYTTDGTDPRLVDGSISPNAMRYEAPIPIAGRATIRARSLDGNKWSAIDGGVYLIDEVFASITNLRITELHYHPEPEGNAEFLELTNIGPKTIRLEGVSIEGGVSFDFPPDEAKSLGPGERMVLVRDREEFAQTYPGLENAVAGQYVGNLSNGGEQLTLRDSDGNIIQQFEYHDSVGWPTLADGHGPSLQLIDSSRDANLASNWRASAVAGGTPGSSEYQVGDANLDGRFDSSDLVLVFQGGEYEDAIDDNSSWRTGDWTGDSDFTTADLVLAFQAGSYSALSVTEVMSIGWASSIASQS